MFLCFQNLSTQVCTDLDAVKIGPYYVQNCKSNDNNIATLLKSLRNILQPVMTDLDSSSSSNAYTTFFKDIAYAPYVRTILTNIQIGASVASEPGRISSTPILFCVDGPDQVTFEQDNNEVDAYTRCQSYLGVPAMILLPTPFIVICPVFFTHAPIPVQSTASCYTVNPHRNQFVQNGKSLIKFQIWHIMHELVHYYVYATTQQDLDVYGINDCLALPARRAVLNPNSYTYYVASKPMT